MKSIPFFRMLELSGNAPAVSRAPQIDWSRSFALWDQGRERHAHYVFLESGEAVVTWCNLASLLGVTEDELTARAGADARAFTIAARHGDAHVLCVRIDNVERFLSEIERSR